MRAYEKQLLARRRRKKEIDLTPMLDVVFIMLIFFIVTSSFVKEPGVELDKPVTENGDFWNVELLFLLWTKMATHYNKERSRLSFNLAEVARIEAPQANVVIQVDKKTPSYVVEEPMDNLRPLTQGRFGISTDEG